MQSLSRICGECVGLKQEVVCLKSQIEGISPHGGAADWPSLQDGGVRESPSGTNQRHTEAVSEGTSFASHVKELRNSVMKKKPQPGGRLMFLFPVNWDPNTKSEVAECVNDILQGKFTDSTVITPLKSKYEHLYASFYVFVTVPVSCMKNVIDCLMCPEAWPSGLLIKRYFHPKKKDG